MFEKWTKNFYKWAKRKLFIPWSVRVNSQCTNKLLTGRNLMSVRLRVTALVNSAADKQLKLEFGSAHRPAVT